jgi:hypothetical protein
MADKKNKKSWYELISSTKGGQKIGDYQESTGGGTPMKKGDKIDYVADNPQEAEMYKKDHPSAIVRVQQPRNEDGQFTYNSANRRTLKYGPSRGETVPPFLLGAKLTFAKKSGKGAFVTEAGKKYSLPEDITSAEKFVEVYKDVKDWLNGDAKGKGGKTGKVVEFTSGHMLDLYAKTFKKVGKNKPKYAKKKSAGPSDKQPIKKSETKLAENAGITTTKKGEVDYSLAKTNKEKFVEDNATEINDLVQLADEKGFDVDIDELVESIATGEFKNFDDIRNALKGIE